MQHSNKQKKEKYGRKETRSKNPKIKNQAMDENSSYVSLMMKRANHRPDTLFIKNIEEPSRFRDRLFMFDAVKETFPAAKKAELLPNGTIKVFFCKKEDLDSAKATNVVAFGNKASIGEMDVFKFKMAFLRVPVNVNEQRLQSHLQKNIPQYCGSLWLTQNANSKYGTLIVSTENKFFFAECLEKGFIKIGPFTFNVKKPEISQAKCWKCGKFGHMAKICPSKKATGRNRPIEHELNVKNTHLKKWSKPLKKGPQIHKKG